MSFREWAKRWYQENGRAEEEITKSDTDFLGCRLRKAIYAVFGFGDSEKVTSMYEKVEINDLYPDMVTPLGVEDEEYNLSVLVAVESMPREKRPEYTQGKLDRIRTLEKQKKATTSHRNNLAEMAQKDHLAQEKCKTGNINIEGKEGEIKRLKEGLQKNPLGRTPMFEEVGETEGELFDFLLKKIGRGGKTGLYSYGDIQKGYWEKVKMEDRRDLLELVNTLCEEKGWHIAFGFGDFLNNNNIYHPFDLEKFAKKLFVPQICRCQEKIDDLFAYFSNIMDNEVLIANDDQILTELDKFTDIDKQLEEVLKKLPIFRLWPDIAEQLEELLKK